MKFKLSVLALLTFGILFPLISQGMINPSEISDHEPSRTECVPATNIQKLPDGEINLFPVSHNRKMGFEGVIFNSEKPTLILLPGVYRGALSSDEILSLLNKAQINWVSIHLSSQPMAVDRGLTFKATFDDITSKTFKDEIKILVKALCVKKPVYVPLSYSATVAAHLTKEDTSLIIETTPMGTFSDGLPDGGLSYNLIDFWYSFNPITSPGWNEMKEANYRRFWRDAINQYIIRYPALAANEKLKEVAVEGYTSMSKAIEYFDLRQTNYGVGPRRTFIIAEKEDTNRRKNQLAALDNALKAYGSMPLTFVIEDSGHNVLNEAPLAWAKALEISISADSTPTKVALISKNGSAKWLTVSEWLRLKENLLQAD
ncbi:MAG: alpha/beta hydrolase [Bdellovibrionota bacterium]